MKIISHRGNLYGPDPATENTIEQAEKCFALGLDVELDVWSTANDGFYLGHNKPMYRVGFPWIKQHYANIWIHCKNHRCVGWFAQFNCFFHENDFAVFTSQGYVWLYPGSKIESKFKLQRPTVACLPELAPDWDISKATHICTDYPVEYQQRYL